MRLKHQWWNGLVAAMLGGLVGVTVAGAAGEQFIPLLTIREGIQRFAGIAVAGWLHRLSDSSQRARWGHQRGAISLGRVRDRHGYPPRH